MASTKQSITKQLQDLVEGNSKIESVYFTADEHYHLRAFKCTETKKMFTRLEDVPEKSKGGVLTGKMQQNGVAGFEIVETVERKVILSATPTEKTPASPIVKADILSILGITEEQLAAVLAATKK